MNILRERPLVVVLIAFVLGFAIGLFLFGWGLTPVQYTGAGPQDLLPAYQQTYLRSLADLYAFDGNQERVRTALAIWPEADGAACQMAAASADPAEATRLRALATILNGVGCDAVEAAPVPVTEVDEGGGSNALVLVCGLLLLLGALIGAIFYVAQRQGRAPSEPRVSGGGYGATGEVPGDAPQFEVDEEAETTPVARFRTTYNRGHDTYDDSFSIENTNGEFLGECGVGISESIGAGSPKNVTAVEVWLFDKNDIRTVTKVLMSDHAFFDEALKAKLAPKGEPVLARPGETVVLETASLIINASIVDMAYGGDEGLPEDSYFEQLTVELSAWSKDGDFGGPDIEGRVDELLNY
jgi:hypothetical protein